MSDYAEDRFHRKLDAALGRAGERDEVEALVAELGTYRKHGVGLSPVGANTAARAVLASDWLAQRIEQAKAEALREAADEWQYRLRRDAALFDYGRWLDAAAHMLRDRADRIGGAS